MNVKRFRLMVTPVFATVLIIAGSPILKGLAVPLKIAQSAEIKGSDVKCDNPKVSVAVPDIKVSAPNPSRLVPNVGRILREGVGVPAPDSEAPNVGAKAQVSAPDAICASATSSEESGQTQSQSVNGLW